ncbi:MAG: type II toxin-antitoxin system VapC family toxin [Chloroflexota bacterium]
MNSNEYGIRVHPRLQSNYEAVPSRYRSTCCPSPYNRPGAIELMMPWLFEHEASASALVYAEIVEYIQTRNNYERHLRALRSLLYEVYPLFPTFAILERYATLRLQMRPPYGEGLIGDIDTLIAATALEHGLTIVTIDRDFLRVSGLSVILLDRRSLAVTEERVVTDEDRSG